MMDMLLAFLTLVVLEIVLGIDNILLIAILSQKVAKERQKTARRVGLILALGGRVGLLGTLFWMSHLETALFSVGALAITARDVVLGCGGLYLLWKASEELENHVLGKTEEGHVERRKAAFGKVMVQIVLMDMVFSLDSVITAVGLVDHLALMVAAIVAAVGVMLLLADAVAGFVDRHPPVKTLALLLLWMVGAMLLLDGVHVEVDKAYLYAGLAFGLAGEGLNILRRHFAHVE